MSDDGDSHAEAADDAKDTLRLALDQWWASGTKENPTYAHMLQTAKELLDPDDEEDVRKMSLLSKELIDEVMEEDADYSGSTRRWARLVRVVRYNMGVEDVDGAIKEDEKLAKFNQRESNISM